MVPLSMLLAGALPKSTGKHSYDAPFLVEIYDKGKAQTRLGIIDSISITRGVGRLGARENQITNDSHRDAMRYLNRTSDRSKIYEADVCFWDGNNEEQVNKRNITRQEVDKVIKKSMGWIPVKRLSHLLQKKIEASDHLFKCSQ